MKHLFVLLLCIAGVTMNASAQTPADTVKLVTRPEKTPEFKGGATGWINFLQKNLDRDLLRGKNAPSGQFRVIANFVVNVDGTVSDIHIEEDAGYGTGEETKRILKKSSRQWVPAYDKGQAVAFRHTQSLTFTN
jgi:protein TonB